MLKLYQQIKERAVKKIDLLIQRGNIDGSWSVESSTSNISSLAKTLHSLLVGEIIKILLEPDSENVQIIFQRLRSHYLTLLRKTDH